MTRDELAQQFALVLLRNPAMQDMAPTALRERAYEYADTFLDDSEEEPDDGAHAAPAPRRAWRVVSGPNAPRRFATEWPNRPAAVVCLDRARARGDAEAVMERWEERWVREEPTREASRCEPPADLQPASPSTKPPWRVQWRMGGGYHEEPREPERVEASALVQELVEALRMNDAGHACREAAVESCPGCMRRVALEKAGATP